MNSNFFISFFFYLQTERRKKFKMRAAVCALFIFAVIGSVAPKPYGGQQQASSDLSPWAQSHMNEVREMANKLRNEYNIQASGRSSGMLLLCFIWDFQRFAIFGIDGPYQQHELILLDVCASIYLLCV